MKTSSPLRIVHLADLHIGYPGPAQLLVGGDRPDAGRPLREVDIELACAWITEQLATLTPQADLVLIAGDVFDRSSPLPRAVAAAARLVAGVRAAGAEIVIIDGNHDAPSRLAHGSPLSFLTSLGAHVVTEKAMQLSPAQWRGTRLEQVVVHAFPASADPEEQEGLIPLDGQINILLAHGRAAGEDDSGVRRGAPPLPSELLRRGWDYAALGDWHGHHHQPLARVPAYYPGSLQALNYGEGRRHPPQKDDPYAVGGILIVDLTPDMVVASLPFHARRPVLRLETISADQHSAEGILDRLEELIGEVPPDALASVKVQHCSAQTLTAINRVRLAALKARCLALEVIFDELGAEIQPSEVPPSAVSIEKQWAAYLADNADRDDDVPWLLEQGTTLFARARAVDTSGEEETA